MSKCGDYAGWNQHYRNDERPCDACKAAHAAYIREYRKQPHRIKADARTRQTRAAALEELRKRYQSEYNLILKEMRRGTR